MRTNTFPLAAARVLVKFVAFESLIRCSGGRRILRGSFLLHGSAGQDSGIEKRVEPRVIGGAGVNLEAPLQNVKLEFEKTPPKIPLYRS